MEQKLCKDCEYYRQHYTFDQRKIFRIYCGHCTYMRAKTKHPHSKSCQNFLQRDPNEEPFVKKEYLSKVLLEYMLQLDLLPEIYDRED